MTGKELAEKMTDAHCVLRKYPSSFLTNATNIVESRMAFGGPSSNQGIDKLFDLVASQNFRQEMRGQKIYRVGAC